MTSTKNDAPAVRSRYAVIAVAVLLAAAVAIAQDTPRFSETVDVALINVDVIVTDRNGERVRGLTADDFILLEEGKPQTIVNFAEYAAGAAEASVSVEGAAPGQRRAAEPPPRQPRTFLIFVDEVGLVHAKEDFRQELAETLRQSLQPGDTGAVLSWTNRMNVRQGFTSDVEALENAIMALPKPGPVFTVDGTFTSFREDEAFWRSVALDPMNSGMIGDFNPVATLEQRSAGMVGYLDLKSKVRAINASMTAMAGAEGRKVLLLVTHRFSRRPGHEYSTPLRATAGPTRPGLYHAMDLIESVHHTANATGFTVYGLYPAGIRATMDSAETGGMPNADAPPVGARDHLILMAETESLDLISDRTGGEYAFGSDALKLLPRVADDFTDYYSLAYRTTTRGFDNRRKIAVRTKNRDYTVRARTEVVERTEKTRMRDRVSAAVFAPLDRGLIPIEVELTGNKLNVRVPISALTTVEKNGVHQGAFSVYLAWNAGGTISETTKKTQPFTIKAAELARAKQSHFTYTVEVNTDAGTRALGVGVLDETSNEYGVVQVPVNPDRGRAREQLGAAG